MLKVILVGAVKSTAISLEKLIENELTPVAVITIPEHHRAMHSDYEDLATLIEGRGVRLIRTLNVNDPIIIKEVAALDADLIMVIGWSRLCGKTFRDCAKIGVIGFHPTMLPQYRGRAALSWTILEGLRVTGGSLFWMDDGVDSGDIAAQAAFPVPEDITLPILLDLQISNLSFMLDGLLTKLKKAERPAVPQDHSQASFVAIRRPEDGLVDWTLGADQVDRLVRALTRPYPGAFTWHRGQKIMIWRAEALEDPRWLAQPGQIYRYENSMPVVRCRGVTSLKLQEYEILDNDLQPLQKKLTGQIKFANNIRSLI